MAPRDPFVTLPPYTPPGDTRAVQGAGCCRLVSVTLLKAKLGVLGVRASTSPGPRAPGLWPVPGCPVPSAPQGIQILLGILHLGCGGVLISSLSEPLQVLTARSCYFIWGGFLFILSGSSSMVAEKKQGVCVVNGFLVLNAISLLASVVGIVLVLWDFSFHHEAFFGPQLELHLVRGLLGVLFTFTAPETCITFFCIYFGWKTRLATSTPAEDFTLSCVPPPAMLPPPPPYHEVFAAVDRRAL
ncbi:membrane-spanning 4-domains subfamily A member 15 isoform X1 [Athene cunicularia]|uniref:membrane-spanning 4-domains subfamily A member 15 isoform X1 n=1 Tax=Athene cunicularia TaxID=194338 RepID=UPI000EF73CF8|nr:membrane-spanning 4-domains subfamily A member 15 isoform X1 [Athene cunicularia]